MFLTMNVSVKKFGYKQREGQENIALDIADAIIDWQHKQSGRARMRTIVRRFLQKYDYPPKGMKEALEIVLKQCEHWTERRSD